MIAKKEKKSQMILTKAYEKYQKGLSVYAYYKIHDPVIGEDLVQNTFMKTWMYLRKGGKIHLMKAFLYHILNNLIVDEYRKNKPTSLDILLDKGFEPGADDTHTLYNSIDGKNALHMLTRLPDKYKDVMHMRYAQSLTLKEIARMTKQSRNTIAVQLHRGLEKLKSIHKK